jgi:hypothetical protein
MCPTQSAYNNKTKFLQFEWIWFTLPVWVLLLSCYLFTIPGSRFIMSLSFGPHSLSVRMHADITMLPPIQYEPSNRCLTLYLLTWGIRCAVTNASKWQMGFNSAFKRLIILYKSERAGSLSKWVKCIHLCKLLIIYTVTENMLLQAM